MDERPQIRADFIRRLFAVAISVGFATSLSRMDWMHRGTMPSGDEWRQLVILITGLFATVLSWDGYLHSIQEKPLSSYMRFLIDVLLVFIYMFFLLTSHLPNFWLPTLTVIYGLYLVWDVLSIRDYPEKYESNWIAYGKGACRAGPMAIVKIYVFGFMDRVGTSRGPITTLSWWLYFVGLAIIESGVLSRAGIIIACIFAIAGLSLYRQDKVTAFRAWQRLSLISFLLSSAWFLL